MENKNTFRHWINHETVKTIANAIQQEYPPFKSKEFSKIEIGRHTMYSDFNFQ